MTVLGPRRWLLLVSPLLLLAFVARLVPVLDGGGLYGYGNYDDGVYFAASVGLVDGRLPYRDFLLLHPPGILLVLAPFAALTTVVGDAPALAVARLAWMALGAVNCALVTRVLWPFGRSAALVGGLCYAVFYPAVYSEHTTLLEAPANTVLLVGLLLARAADRERPPGDAATETVGRTGWNRWLVVGLVLGLSPTFKIWGVIPVIVVGGWLAMSHGRRALARYAVGAAIGPLAVLGPFFAAAPAAMWRLVVHDQVRRTSTHWALLNRVRAIVGLGNHPLTTIGIGVLAVVAVGWLVLWLAAVAQPRARLFAVLHAGMGGLLLVTPTWFSHYAGFVAGSAALVVGAGTAALATIVQRWWTDHRAAPVARSRLIGRWLAGGTAVLLLVAAVPLAWASFGTPYPTARLAHGVRGVSGCVTTDDPTNLIELDLLSPNLRRGCPLVVDLGGYSYDVHPPGRTVPRKHNRRWEALAMGYLSSGSRTVLSRFSRPSNTPFDPATLSTIRSWRLTAHWGHIVARVPVPVAG